MIQVKCVVSEGGHGQSVSHRPYIPNLNPLHVVSWCYVKRKSVSFGCAVAQELQGRMSEAEDGISLRMLDPAKLLYPGVVPVENLSWMSFSGQDGVRSLS